MWDSETCCGFTAAAVSIVAFGTFAVPIKCKAATRVTVDPLVLQTYKILMCFLTSWLILLPPFSVPLRLSPYGLLSGLSMVPGGTAGYFAVRTAGLAVSQGTWSSLKVLVAFAWGWFVFHEPVRSRIGSIFAILLLLVGFSGMAYFASPSSRTDEPSSGGDLEEPLIATEDSDNDDGWILFGVDMKRWGVLGAVIDGVYGGSVLVPMHFARKSDDHFHGLGYLLSFSSGCLAVVLCVWLARWAYVTMIHANGSWQNGWQALPSFYISTVGLYALLAGFIWSVGNFGVIISVDVLGQGLGYSLVQTQLLVAGLWAVFYYREIRGWKQIVSWFCFAILTLVSMLWLAQQHSSA